jgi:biopolymer transport protein ExbB
MKSITLGILLGVALLAGAQAQTSIVAKTTGPADVATSASGTAASPQPADEGPHLVALFKSGGLLMWPILLCSVIMVAFGLERAVGLRAAHIFPAQLNLDLKTLARAGKSEEARERCLADPSPFARLMLPCLQRSDNPGFEMEVALEEAGARVLYDLRRNCKPLAVIADVSPLLGLMGTVTGMIKAFDVVARSGALGRTELLAEGISEALLTTAFGLIVAIPAVVIYHIFRSKAENLLRMMEDAGLDILTALRHAAKDATQP